MNVKRRVKSLEQKAGKQIVVAVIKGEYFDAEGKQIPTEKGPPKNFSEILDSANIGSSVSDERVPMKREKDEDYFDFQARMEATGREVGRRAGADITLMFGIDWL
ncbi:MULTISPECIES: hypothetical protein [unclassified Ruegeria]|uniref:hypothetical protein n=1 Tax=unclassified Ruegeria TaxID=2625375 RepID=UPI0014891909|nr:MULTISPECIES: hypothetical protein [unclassified Ruegeria]